jgi:hypothetical protein
MEIVDWLFQLITPLYLNQILLHRVQLPVRIRRQVGHQAETGTIQFWQTQAIACGLLISAAVKCFHFAMEVQIRTTLFTLPVQVRIKSGFLITEIRTSNRIGRLVVLIQWHVVAINKRREVQITH